MRVVGISGLAGSGKTTIARYLMEQYGYVRVRFADPLKQMLRTLGLSDSDVDGATKEVRNDILCGRTPRYAMQRLGTEFGREMIGEDLWVNAWRHRVLWQAEEGVSGVVADDVRFPNEVASIYKLGGFIVHVTRPNHSLDASVAAHASETHQLERDIHLINDGDVAKLLRMVDFHIARNKEAA